MGKPRSMHGEYTEYPLEMQQAPARPVFSGSIDMRQEVWQTERPEAEA